jgi:hypothetical protein
MKLRCREGDMALVIMEDPGYEENIGRIVTVYGPVEINPKRGPTWLIVPASPFPWSVWELDGRKCIRSIALRDRIEHSDAWLLPLRPEEELDQLVQDNEEDLCLSESGGLDGNELGTLNEFDAAMETTEHAGPLLSQHPRIVRLRQQVDALPVDHAYRCALHDSIRLYAGQLINRPEYDTGDEWDDFEALQQVTLGDAMERSLLSMFDRPTDKN